MQLQLQRLVAASLLAPSIATMAIGDDDASPLAAALFPGICEDTATKELSAVRAVACPAGTQRVRVAGANIFDTLWVGSSGMNTCCNASGGPATYPDALEALESASTSGIRVFRFFGSLFGAATKAWVQDPARYWSEY